MANLKESGAEVVVLRRLPGFAAQAIKNADRMGWHPQFIMTTSTRTR